MISIDGAHAEGGGSIARVALALSTLAQKAVEIKNIRLGREQPGLKSQHLFCIRALEKLCNAKTEGAHLGSTYLKYVPGKIEGKSIEIDIETAGSIPLFTQAILLPSLFANKTTKYTIIGGTDGKWAAPIDYFREIFLPHIQKFAFVECKTIKRGYYPKGNGRVELTIRPKNYIHGFNTFNDFSKKIKEETPKIHLIEQGSLVQIKGISHASKDLQQAQVAERQAKAAEITLSKLNCPIRIVIEYQDTLSTGSGITLFAVFSKNNEINIDNPVRLGSDALGEKGKKAEQVGIEAAEKLIEEIQSKAAVDLHLCDQLLPYMALLPGSAFKASHITNHTYSNIHTIEQFFGKKFELEGNLIRST